MKSPARWRVLLVCGAWVTTGMLACGQEANEAEKPSVPTAQSSARPAQGEQPAQPAPRPSEGARTEQQIRAMMSWPDGRGPAPDVMRDYRACMSFINADPEIRSAHALVRYARMAECMTDKGWIVDPDAGAAAAGP